MEELIAEKEVCLALGYFDSVHVGHRHVISVAKHYASAHGIACAVATFSNNAYKVFNPDGKAVYTYAERCQLLDGLCDYVLPIRFDARLKKHSAETFLSTLFSRYNVKAVVCGYDYMFGSGGKGDAELLKRFCGERSIDCIVVDKFELDGIRASTTNIKDMLANRDIESVNRILTVPYMIIGTVVRGRGVGRSIDIPTANMNYSSDKFLPGDGVYGTVCTVDNKEYKSITNIGARPTFGIIKRAVETMLDGFSDNIYGKEIKLDFYKFIREIKRFETPAELSVQVHKDMNWSM